MDKQTQEYFEKLGRVLDPKMAAINNDESTKIAKVFVLACESIVQFCLFMSQNENGKEVLYDMFGEASEIQLERASRLLTFWFLWQRDWARGLNFIQSEKNS